MNGAGTPAALLIVGDNDPVERATARRTFELRGLRLARSVDMPSRPAVVAREIRRCWYDGLPAVWILTGTRARTRASVVAAAGLAFNCLSDGTLPIGATPSDDGSWELADDRHRLIVTTGLA